jgi:predicted AlkP superfamily pyrophosphatase or phosphodiesterase
LRQLLNLCGSRLQPRHEASNFNAALAADVLNLSFSYRRRRAIALLACVLLALPGLLAQQPGGPPPRPKLIVVIVVDQMRADYVDRFRDRWRGGLRRLVDQGAWLRNAAYPYAATETCPAHATVSTGVFPATHGIVANAWWDRQTSARVTCTADSSVRSIGIERTTASGDSAARLSAPTFAGQLRAAISGSRVVTMSLKARSAIMLAGPRADAVLWQNDSTAELLTSSAYGAEIPPFASRFVRANPQAADFSKVWDLTGPPSSYTGGRSLLGEDPPPGWTTTFPHPFSAGEQSPGSAFLQRWRTSPFADAWLGRLAAAAVDELKLGSGSGVDFLGISFSATDYVGHAFGPDSREIEDNLLVLDQTIGALLEKLDRAVGAGQYVVVLTGDHGVAPVPEQAQLQGRDAGRVNPRSILARVENLMAQRLGAGRHVAQLIGPNLYFAPGVAARLDADADLWRDVQQAVLAEPGVERVLRRAGPPPARADAITRALALDLFSERSGDVWIGLKANWIFSARTLLFWADGTNHGAAHDYDQRVPIILFGAGIKPGRYTMSATPADIAPTLAFLSGMRMARTDGRILEEALAARPSQPARATGSAR